MLTCVQGSARKSRVLQLCSVAFIMCRRTDPIPIQSCRSGECEAPACLPSKHGYSYRCCARRQCSAATHVICMLSKRSYFRLASVTACSWCKGSEYVLSCGERRERAAVGSKVVACASRQRQAAGHSNGHIASLTVQPAARGGWQSAHQHRYCINMSSARTIFESDIDIEYLRKFCFLLVSEQGQTRQPSSSKVSKAASLPTALVAQTGLTGRAR